MILRDQAQFELARRLRSKSGAPIADVFTFLSGLYFRGKIAYATAFARPPRGTRGVLVITPTRGLTDARTRIRLDDLREFAEVDIHEDDPRYRLPIECDARRLATKLPAQGEVILLGRELSYIPVAGAIVNGKRPPKLAPRRCAVGLR